MACSTEQGGLLPRHSRWAGEVVAGTLVGKPPVAPSRRERRGATAARAFTLFEVLLAVVIGAGLFLAVLTFYQQTADTRENVGEELDAIGSARRIMQHFTAEIRAAAHPDNGVALSGSRQSISFATTSLPAASPEGEQLVRGGLVRVEYGLGEGEEGAAGITRREVPLMPRAPQPEDAEALPSRDAGEENAGGARALLLTDQLAFLRFRYWDGEQWADSWQGSELPAAVQIMLAVDAAPEELEPEEYPPTVFRRTVNIGYRVPDDPDAMLDEEGEGAEEGEGGGA